MGCLHTDCLLVFIWLLWWTLPLVWCLVLCWDYGGFVVSIYCLACLVLCLWFYGCYFVLFWFSEVFVWYFNSYYVSEFNCFI